MQQYLILLSYSFRFTKNCHQGARYNNIELPHIIYVQPKWHKAKSSFSGLILPQNYYFAESRSVIYPQGHKIFLTLIKYGTRGGAVG
jgi:hypothetical protein